MISEGIEVIWFASIHLILEAKFREDPLRLQTTLKEANEKH